MSNPIFAKIISTLPNGTVFGRTDIDAAEEFFNTVGTSCDDKVSISIIGSPNVGNVKHVSNALKHIFQYFESKANFKIITGDNVGVERIVQKIAKMSNIECDVIKQGMRSEWEAGTNRLEIEKERKLVQLCHVLIVLSDSNIQKYDRVIKLARSEGRLVTTRKLPT